MKKKLFYLVLSSAVILSSSCKKFLEVQPEDKYVMSQVFSSEKAIQQALNGIYQNMASANLYGGNLSTTVIELMGQRYNTASLTTPFAFTFFQKFSYQDQSAISIIDIIWTEMYANILQTNQFIEQIDVAGRKGVISVAKVNELKGEAIGLRALMHLDILRFFGPVYRTSSFVPALPYYTKAEPIARPMLKGTEFMDSVLTDLSASKKLLTADPVINTGVNISSTDFYNGSRNQRFNYYAAVALEARAYLYKGDNAKANAAAKEALAAIDSKFPWLPFSSILSNPNPDRIFSTEVIFGLYNPNMYLNQQSYFSTALLNTQILMGLPARVSNIFDANQNDYRYNATWAQHTFTNGTVGSVFIKYADLNDQTKPWRFVQPMLRKSELYYILAETEPELATAFSYLNRVRNNRGLLDLATTNSLVLTGEIQREYQREFTGEGQIYYFYKRKGASVPNGNSTANINPNYVIPLPLSETTPR